MIFGISTCRQNIDEFNVFFEMIHQTDSLLSKDNSSTASTSV